MAELLQILAAVAVGIWIGRRIVAAIAPDYGVDYTTALLLHWALEPDEPPRMIDLLREGERQARALDAAR